MFLLENLAVFWPKWTNFEIDRKSLTLAQLRAHDRNSGNFEIFVTGAILEYIDISDSVLTFVLDILTVADGCHLIIFW